MKVKFHSFACEYPIFPALFIEKTVISLLYILGNIVEDELTTYVLVYFWALCSLLVYMSVFLPVSYNFNLL